VAINASAKFSHVLPSLVPIHGGNAFAFHNRMLDHVRGNAFAAEEPVACLPVLIDLFPYQFRCELRRE
jgi:hypothetical protein